MPQAQAQTNSLGTPEQAVSSGKVILGGKIGGIAQAGLRILRPFSVAFLLLYGFYMAVGIAFGQGDARDLVSFILGAMVAVAAPMIASIFTGWTS